MWWVRVGEIEAEVVVLLSGKQKPFDSRHKHFIKNKQDNLKSGARSH